MEGPHVNWFPTPGGDRALVSLHQTSLLSASQARHGLLVSMAQTRKEEAIDHLIDLQCDPAYLRRHIKGLFSTTLFRMADTEDAAMMVAKYIHLEYKRHYWWYWIEIECKHVRDLHDRFSDSTHPGQPIPPKYDLALGALELLLVNQALVTGTGKPLQFAQETWRAPGNGRSQRVAGLEPEHKEGSRE